MIVNLNGQHWYDTDIKDQLNEVFIVKKSDKLKKVAISIWATSGVFLARSIVHAGSFYESMQPLTYTFQDIALGLGILFGLSGFILLGIKKRWGVSTLKTTAFVVGGVFLVPSILLLVGIVGTLLNEAFVTAFEEVRGSEKIKDVMGK